MVTLATHSSTASSSHSDGDLDKADLTSTSSGFDSPEDDIMDDPSPEFEIDTMPVVTRKFTPLPQLGYSRY